MLNISFRKYAKEFFVRTMRYGIIQNNNSMMSKNIFPFRRRGFSWLSLLFVVFFSCDDKPEKIRILYSVDEPIGQIAKTLKEVIEREHDLEVELIIGEGSIANLDSLSKNKADLTIVENYVPFRKDVKSILPFYPQVLHIFYTSDTIPESFEKLLYGNKVFIGAPGSTTHRFMLDLFDYFSLDRSQFQIARDPFEYDVLVGFTDIIKMDFLAGFEGHKLYSFDDVLKFGKGSIVEGISLTYPQVRPFIIPELTYGSLTTMPVMTLSTDAVLVARSDIPDQLIYDITKSIFQDRQEFTSIGPLLYIDLNEDFDRSKLNFPLANGARIYLDRDEPGFLERYAELGGVLFSVILALITAVLSVSRWQNQRKKDRVDVFYAALMNIKNKLAGASTIHQGLGLIKEIKNAEKRAFQMLIDEKLVANESFRIYMELSKDTIEEVKLRLKQIQLKQKSA